MSEWTLAREHVDAIRDARSAVLAAAASESPGALEHAIAEAVRAMWAAEFSRQTICSLITAAVDTGLPRRRNYVRRASDVRRWSEQAAVCVDAIATGVDRRA